MVFGVVPVPVGDVTGVVGTVVVVFGVVETLLPCAGAHVVAGVVAVVVVAGVVVAGFG